MTTSNGEYHRALTFQLWTSRGAWFWRLAGRYCGGATVGSASSEAEALREAQTAADEISARCSRAVAVAEINSDAC